MLIVFPKRCQVSANIFQSDQRGCSEAQRPHVTRVVPLESISLEPLLHLGFPLGRAFCLRHFAFHLTLAPDFNLD